VLLGGLAVILHGLSRNTKDYSIWLDSLPDVQTWTAPIQRRFATPEIAAIAVRESKEDSIRAMGWKILQSIDQSRQMGIIGILVHVRTKSDFEFEELVSGKNLDSD
jgi:hypothetical protein